MPIFRTFIAGSFLVLGTMMCVAQTVHAQSLSSTVIGSYSTFGSARNFDSSVATSAQIARTETASNFNFSDATAGGTARAQTNYGTNRTFARASVAADPGNRATATAETKATSTWSDLLTVSKPGLNGTTGTATYSFAVDGTIFGNIGAYKAERRFQVFHNGNLVGQLTNSLPNGTYSETLTTTAFAITYGQPFTLSVSLESYAYRFEDTITTLLTSRADYENTATFTGFSVADTGGTPVTGASYVASSGTTSYSLVGAPAVVPEANSLALALPAFGMIGAVVIKRRKK
jgi:hypothetical protein